MKSLITFICLWTIFFLWSCDSQPLPSYTPNTTYEIQTRGILTTTSSLPEGSQALFNASGGISITNNVYTYEGHSWKNNDITQTSNSTETTLTALYPAYNGANNFITQNPYTTDGALEDVLMAQAIFTDQTNIELEFHHLFSLLTIHVQDELNETLSEISLKAPKVESINAISGDISISGEHTTLLSKNTIGKYLFIVPPISNGNLVLTFRFTDNEISHQLTHTFLKGNKYECNVIKADTRPGIRNADDLIAFAELINKEHKGKRTLSEFGEQEGSTMVYRLLANITLTEEDCQKLIPIGNHSSTPFNDTFDGEGHSIHNLILPNVNTDINYTGLFGYIESSGIVQNLKINNASVLSNDYTYLGIIARSNYGTINNCSVTNSTIYSEKDEVGIGLICALSTGAIVNCYTINNTIHLSSSTYAGAIAGSAETRIVNCYSTNNKFYINGSKNTIGSITGATSTKMLNIRNCYIYHTQNTSDWHAAIGQTTNASIRSFYHNKGELYGGKLGTTTQNIGIYDTEFKYENIHISELLNEWIDTTGKNTYPQYTFNRWTTSPDGSPCFE